ncbi:uncharacterized protein B0P05DRAFT_581127 [Gilbertella persicaria]|uniref:uncharacterized protein n=1 Tax=Gilbertella persicaria TaxID=101096 RepID=UPI0022211071|nr:uncharacterized protein B0P05DRAFT_581127 [Gilbertella persicaria]KAI8063434.1 hypothetical protein B0P05DRAFT_581127 [Gilbertella persicaria]
MDYYEDDSDYSIDYEYLGPRQPNYRNENDADSDASELSARSYHDGFDMWDEDPYSTNDFTWQSNDMRLTGSIKKRQKELYPWPSFWRKEKGWPRQLPASNSTTNHDQSANALSLVSSEYGTQEKLHAVYRDRIIECGHAAQETQISTTNTTTLLDHESANNKTSSDHTTFISTHASIPVKHTYIPIVNTNGFMPYTKYIQRTPSPQAFLALSFEPMCLAEKYGYMAIGGIEDGLHLICVGDEACIFHFSVQTGFVLSAPQKISLTPEILSLSFTPSPYNYVAWSASSLFFAHTSDTHNSVIVWRTRPKMEMVYRIDAGGYTYAIQFHPEQEGVLVFSNRYGYIHTVDLETCILRNQPELILKLSDQHSQHECHPHCLQGTDTIHHTCHLLARHEITMVSFRGEKNRRLRILAKINGLQWSRDGTLLYVSTKKRVLAYEFLSSRVWSLKKIASQAALRLFETNLGKRKRDQASWHDQWAKIPPHLQSSVLWNTQLASHW